MYSLSIPVAQLRTKMRQEFERHRYVNQLGVIDMLLFQSHAEFQVRGFLASFGTIRHLWGVILEESCRQKDPYCGQKKFSGVTKVFANIRIFRKH
jgi:hypothetical protein